MERNDKLLCNPLDHFSHIDQLRKVKAISLAFKETVV